jgi:ligand-binding sensor domain-containing protein
MRGPQDNNIEARQAPVATAGLAAAPVRSRLPGGKALLRQLQLLESAGFTQVAASAIQSAVSEENREEFRIRSARFSAAPSGTPAAVAPGAEGFTGMTSEGIARMYMEAAERLRPPTADEPQWQSLGPSTIPNGQTYGASRVNVSGRISSVVVDPRNPAHVLAGAANGGVWESFDRGASWAPRSDFAPTLTVGALAFDPSNTSTVYCGTGEGNAWYNSPFGAGILRSSDGGTTWSILCTNPFVGQGFYNLDVNPANGQHLIASTTNGLYVSTDGGINWTERRSSITWSLSIAPAGGASAEILAACSDGLWSSTDEGTTWSAVTLPSSPGNFDRFAVDIAASNPSVAYAWGASGGNGYLWRRSGGNWTLIGNPPDVNVGQAWYDWFVAAAPDRDTQVYCGAISVHRGDLSGATWTWIDIASKPAGDSIHPDQHAIAFEPGNPETIYIGNDGGLFRSNNRGINWQHCNNGLVISEFEYLAQDYGSSRWLIGGTQDNGTQRWTGSPIWEHIADGDGGDCGINRTNPQIAFHTYYDMSPERSGSAGNFGSWTWIAPVVQGGEGNLFYPPFETSATNGDTIAIGGGALYVSRDNGTNWTRLAYSSNVVSSALYIPNADNVYVGTTNGQIFQTQWNGANWTTLTALTTPRSGAYVSDLFVDPNNLSRLWATSRRVGGGRVFRSENGGSSWLDLTTGLPELPINAIEVDPENANRIWVAADLGVYQSLDGGNSWTDFSNGLPNMYVGDLLFHPHARVLRAGTRNRGVWEIPVDGWMTQPICAIQFTGSLQGNQTGRWFTFNWPATWHMLWTVMPTTPLPGSPQVSWKVEVERTNAEYVTYWIVVTNLTPAPVSFEGRYCILSRY